MTFCCLPPTLFFIIWCYPCHREENPIVALSCRSFFLYDIANIIFPAEKVELRKSQFWPRFSIKDIFHQLIYLQTIGTHITDKFTHQIHYYSTWRPITQTIGWIWPIQLKKLSWIHAIKWEFTYLFNINSVDWNDSNVDPYRRIWRVYQPQKHHFSSINFDIIHYVVGKANY